MSRRKAGKRRKVEGDCVVPPPIPPESLHGFRIKRDPNDEARVRSYLEHQASDEKVAHVEKVSSETVGANKYNVWDVHTDKARWWVIDPPMNLYRQDLLPSADYALSLHIGLIARVMARREPGVPDMEHEMLARPWRKWEQAAEALDEADEAEEFQTVGMRCRECMIALVKEFGKPEMVPPGQPAPKGGDAVHWTELIANSLAHGASAEHVRKYLKSTAKVAWELVSWLTHAQGASRADAELAIDVTQHFLSIFGTALFRKQRGIPDQCPQCGSYKIGLRVHPEALAGSEPVPACRVCQWITPVAPRRAYRPATAHDAAQVAARKRKTDIAAILASSTEQSPKDGDK